MTTIAWDGRTLAADKRANVAGVRCTIRKIARGSNGNLVAVAGTVALIEDIMAWLCQGAERPEGQGEKNEWCSVMEITPDGECWVHERLGRYRIEDDYAAIGTGSDFALAAMACGKTASEAIKIAARFDTRTGDGVDALTLASRSRPRSRRAA